jgi:amino acid adenylation domain-containing protein
VSVPAPESPSAPGDNGEAAIRFARDELEHGILARFASVVARCGERTALAGGGAAWTYGDLDRRSNAIAQAILDRAAPGKGCVAYLVAHGLEMVATAFGILKAGGAYLCLHPNMPLAALREVVRDAAPVLLLADAAHEDIARGLAGGECPVLPLDAIAARHAAAPAGVKVAAGDPAVIFYTSGSTGRPKGVVKSHRTVLHRAWLSAKHDGVVPSDRQSLLTWCSFASSEADCFGALLNGASLHLFDVAARGHGGLGAWIDGERITLLHPPVVLFRRYLARLTGTGLHPSVRLVALAGETVLASDLALWRKHFAPSSALRHRFSSTEAGHIAVGSVAPFAALAPGAIPPARPVEDKAVAVVDERGAPVAAGETGELVVSSAFLAEGYWRRPDASAEHFRPDPDHPGRRVFRTGDLVRLNRDGCLEFAGRRDAQVKINGYRVEIAEIERALLGLPDIREAAVIAEPRNGANALVAFVVLQPGEAMRADAIKRALRAVLPQWKVPAFFHALDALPLTATGKPDRGRLRTDGGSGVSGRSSGR